MLSCVDIKENVGYDMAANRRRYPEWMVGTLCLEQNMGYSFRVLLWIIVTYKTSNVIRMNAKFVEARQVEQEGKWWLGIFAVLVIRKGSHHYLGTDDVKPSSDLGTDLRFAIQVDSAPLIALFVAMLFSFDVPPFTQSLRLIPNMRHIGYPSQHLQCRPYEKAHFSNCNLAVEHPSRYLHSIVPL